MTNKASGRKLKNIYNDKTSGSNEILSELHEHLKGERKMLEVFPMLFEEIKSQFKSFQSVNSYLKDLENSITTGKELDNFFNKYDKLFNNVYSKIFEKNKTILKKINKVVTLSNSKTVYEILCLLKNINPKLNVIVCESRPKYEGRILVKKIIDAGIETKLIIDSAVAREIINADAAFIGADIILKNGDVINKTGSCGLAVLCYQFSIPFYVITDKTKFSSSNKFMQKEMPPGEIWRHSHPKLKINNLYFEKVEKKYITKILTS